MSKRVASTSASITRLDVFGPPPLLGGEDAAAYNELLVRVSAAVKPTDIVEEIWVRDIVDLAWEVFRLRRIKAGLLAAATQNEIKRVLAKFLSDGDAQEVARDWTLNDKNAREVVQAYFDMVSLTLDGATARAFEMKIKNIELIDRMIASAEARRNIALREIERHRVSVAERLRRASEIEDAEFEEVTTVPAQHQLPTP
jgi:hypothetical protein